MLTPILNTLIGVTLTAFSLSVQAEWRVLANNADGQYFYDDQFFTEGSQISFWRMTDFATPLTNLEGRVIMSEKIRTTVDCNNAKIANSLVTRFAKPNAQGDIMNHYETPLRFTKIAPDTIDFLLFKEICSHH